MKALHWGILAAAVGGLTVAARRMLKGNEADTDTGKEMKGNERNTK